MDKKVKNFWVYTIILFSVAFVIILLSAATGIRFNEQREENENLYNGAQKSLINLTNENEKLRESLAEEKEKNSELSEEMAALEEEKNKITEQSEKYKKSVENVVRARELLRRGKYFEAGEAMKEVECEGFSPELMEMYNFVKSHT